MAAASLGAGSAGLGTVELGAGVAGHKMAFLHGCDDVGNFVDREAIFQEHPDKFLMDASRASLAILFDEIVVEFDQDFFLGVSDHGSEDFRHEGLDAKEPSEGTSYVTEVDDKFGGLGHRGDDSEFLGEVGSGVGIVLEAQVSGFGRAAGKMPKAQLLAGVWGIFAFAKELSKFAEALEDGFAKGFVLGWRIKDVLKIREAIPYHDCPTHEALLPGSWR